MANDKSNQIQPRQRFKRQPLSCKSCRQRKLRCDRQVPCSSCIRHGAEALCHQFPAPRRATLRRRKDKNPSPLEDEQSLPLRSWTTDDRSREAQTQPFHTPACPTASARSNPVAEADSVASLLSRRVFELSNLRTKTRSSTISNGAFAFLLPQILAASETETTFAPYSSLGSPLWREVINEETYWRYLLIHSLPTQTQCDVLVAYFVENINWIFQSIHVISFRSDYHELWMKRLGDVDLIWLSLLYTVISLSGLYLPSEMAAAVGLDPSNIRKIAEVWHLASRQALIAGRYDSKPCITQLLTFQITQLYWYAMNQVEALNSHLGQAVRNAQALGLDKDTTPSAGLEQEMRHRIWWDLCASDTFQSMCLGRPPLIQAHRSQVPEPLNCNDVDIEIDRITPRSLDSPTEMSMNICRFRIFRLFNTLCLDDCAHLREYDFVKAIDKELIALVESFPWYFQIDKNRQCAALPIGYDYIRWQHHILQTCVCTQRIRMFRPFLFPRVRDSWEICAEAAKNAFVVYNNINNNGGWVNKQRGLAQGYQQYSTAVALAALALVERELPFPAVREEIDMAISDLQPLDSRERMVPVASHGRKILTTMLLMLDRRGSGWGIDMSSQPHELAPAISSVFGGEQTASAYLKRYVTGHGASSKQEIPGSLRHSNTRSWIGSTSTEQQHCPKQSEQGTQLLGDGGEGRIEESNPHHSTLPYDYLPLEILDWDQPDFLASYIDLDFLEANGCAP